MALGPIMLHAQPSGAPFEQHSPSRGSRLDIESLLERHNGGIACLHLGELSVLCSSHRKDGRGCSGFSQRSALVWTGGFASDSLGALRGQDGPAGRRVAPGTSGQVLGQPQSAHARVRTPHGSPSLGDGLAKIDRSLADSYPLSRANTVPSQDGTPARDHSCSPSPRTALRTMGTRALSGRAGRHISGLGYSACYSNGAPCSRLHNREYYMLSCLPRDCSRKGVTPFL